MSVSKINVDFNLLIDDIEPVPDKDDDAEEEMEATEDEYDLKPNVGIKMGLSDAVVAPWRRKYILTSILSTMARLCATRSSITTEPVSCVLS